MSSHADGRIAIWAFAPAVQIRVVGSLVVVAFPLVFVGLMVTPPVFAAIALIAAIYGAANGIMTIVRGLVIPEMLTRDAYWAINGALAVPTILAKAAAPFGAALLWDRSGSYGPVLIALLSGAWTMAKRRKSSSGHEAGTPRRPPWTDADVFFLKDALARGMSFADLARFLVRTEDEVQEKARELSERK